MGGVKRTIPLSIDSAEGGEFGLAVEKANEVVKKFI
jgi:hypothetical protein